MLPKSFCFKLMSHQNQKIKNQRLLETTVILSGLATNKRARVLRGFHISSLLMPYTHRHGKVGRRSRMEGRLVFMAKACPILERHRTSSRLTCNHKWVLHPLS